MGKRTSIGRELPRQLRADLNRLEAISLAVGAGRDLTATLQLIVDQLCESSPWSMADVIMLEETRASVRVSAQHGLPRSLGPGVSFSTVGSGAFAVMQSGKPLICEDTTLSEFPIVAQASAAAGFRSFLAVPLPLVSPPTVLAVFSRDVRHYSPEDVVYLEAVAHQAAVTIQNAQLYEREHHLVGELTKLATELRSQNEALERAAAHHAELTNLVLEEKGLGSIARTLVRILGNPVAMEDPAFRPLAWAAQGSSPGAAMPSSFGMARLVDAPSTGGEVKKHLEGMTRHRHTVRIPPSEAEEHYAARVVAPVMAGRELMGYLSVIESGRRLETVDVMTVERAATVCALELLRQKAAFEVELRLRADFLADLLTGGFAKEETVLSRAAFLGFHLWNPCTLLVVDADDFEIYVAGQEVRAVHAKQVLLRATDEVVARYSPHRLVAPLSDCVVILASLKPTEAASRRTEVLCLAGEIQRRISEQLPDLAVSLGIGPECSDWAEVRRSYDQAMRAIHVNRNLNRRGQVATFDQLGILGVLFSAEDRAGLLEYPRRLLAPLLAYDRRRKSELVRSLAAYLDNGPGLQTAARALGIHVNTLRQRLERVRELTGAALEDPDTRLELQLAIRVLNLMDSSLKSTQRPTQTGL